MDNERREKIERKIREANAARRPQAPAAAATRATLGAARESVIQAKIRAAHRSEPKPEPEPEPAASTHDAKPRGLPYIDEKKGDEFGNRLEPEPDKYDGPILTADVTFGDDPHFNYNEPLYNEEEGAYAGIGAMVVPEDTIDDFLVSGMIIDESLEQQELEQDQKRAIKRVVCYSMCCLSIFLAIFIPVGIVFFGKNKGTKAPTITPTQVPSMTPSTAPTSLRFDQFGEKLSFISDPEHFRDNTSPQFRALSFIADEDDIGIDAPNLVQRYIMAVFYYSMDGDNWTYCKKQEGAECKCRDDFQAGIACGTIKRKDKPYIGKVSECNWFKNRCKDDGTVITNIEFQTVSNGLNGELPTELQHLTSLRSLKIANNEFFYGEAAKKIPEYLKVVNAVYGTIPDFIGNNLTNLEYLTLSSNKFSGTIPDSLYKLKKLKELKLAGNILTGTISPKIEQLSDLKLANFSNNFLTGSVPAEIGNITGLDVLMLYQNDLNGTMPEPVCLLELEKLYADCDGNYTEVECTCCTKCFDDNNSTWKRFYDVLN